MTNPSTITRTIMIFDQPDRDIVFFKFEGDLSHLNDEYISSEFKLNSPETELNDLLFDSDGKRRQEAFKDFPHDYYIPGQTAVIVAGLVL